MTDRVLAETVVIIAAYNAEATVGAAVASALVGGQEVAVVVVDDGSTDRTAMVAMGAGASVIRQGNTGAALARRAGLKASQSPFVVFLDSDDELLPSWLSALERLRESPSLSVVGGGIMRVGKRRSKATFPPLGKETTETLLQRAHAPWPASASVWRREKLVEAERVWPPALSPRYAEDFESLIRASMVGGVCSVSYPIAVYRMGGGKSSAHAREAFSDSERVRRHYGHALGYELRFLSAGEQRDVAVWRTAMAAFYERGPLGVGRLALRHPQSVSPLARIFFGRLHSRLVQSPAALGWGSAERQEGS